MLPHIVAFFQPCSFGLAISVFACRVLFVLIYSVPARTIHPRFVLAHSVQHFLCVPFLLAFPVQFSYQFLLRSFLSSIFPQSQSQSLSLSLSVSAYLSQPLSLSLSVSLSLSLPCTIFPVQSKPRGHSIYIFPFSLCLKDTRFDLFHSVQARGLLSPIFAVQTLPHGFLSPISSSVSASQPSQSDLLCSDPASRFHLFYFLFCPCLTASSVRFCRLVYAFQRYYPSCFPCRHGLTPAPDWHRFSTVANAYGNSWAGRCIVS